MRSLELASTSSGPSGAEPRAAAIDAIMSGAATDAQIAAFLTALHMKGETVEELIGFAQVMRSTVARLRTRADEVAGLTGGRGVVDSLASRDLLDAISSSGRRPAAFHDHDGPSSRHCGRHVCRQRRELARPQRNYFP